MRRAWEGDPVSAFGSVLGFNVPVDAAAAEFLAEPDRFVEAIIAPDFTPEAFEILTTKPKWKANVRLLKVGQIEPGRGGLELRQISGGMLCQTADDLPDDETRVESRHRARSRANAQLADLRFAWAVCRHVKSNAIVLAKDQALVGVGAGQMSRVDSVEIAIHKAGERSRGSALRLRRIFPVRRFDPPRRRGRRRGHHPAGRLAPRRRSDRRLQPARPADDLHRPAAFPALRMVRIVARAAADRDRADTLNWCSDSRILQPAPPGRLPASVL